VSEGEGIVYHYASYEEGSSRIGEAGEKLTAAGDDYAAVQGRASAQLRQWQPAVPVADALEQVEAKLTEATRLGAADLHWTSGQLTASRDTMLKAEGDNTALAQHANQGLRGGDLGRLDEQGDGSAGTPTGTSGDGGPPGRIAQLLGGEDGGGEPGYEYNMIENPGPLADLPGNPAANFAGGRYNEVTLDHDTTFYRGGQSGAPLGQWFTTDKPASAAQVRIDTAVLPHWIDPKTGASLGSSPIDTVYGVKIPTGTKIYPGPTANQGGVYVGGKEQIFIPKPWNIPGVEVTGSEPLK